MKRRIKVGLWSVFIVGGFLVAVASIVVMREHPARPSTQAADAAPLPGLAGASKQNASPPLSATAPDNDTVTPPKMDADKQMAIATAEEALRSEKVRRLVETGAAIDDTVLKAESYSPRDVVIEADGSEHVRMDRKLRGLRVVGGGIVVHSREGRLLSMTRTLDLQVPNVSTMVDPPRPTLSPDEAVLAASQYFQPELLQEPTANAVYFARENRPILAYEVDLLGLDKDRIPASDLIYIDAATGAYLGRDRKVHRAMARGTAYTLNRGKVAITTNKVNARKSPDGRPGYILTDPSRGGSRTLNAGDALDYEKVITAADDYMDLREVATIPDSMLGKPYFDTDNVWGTSQVDLSQRIGAEVHYGLAKTWDYFKQRHDRRGIANDGKGMRAIANIASANSEFTNAFWMDGLNTMFYLNGSAEEGSNPVIEIDVAGHEMTHGVTHATAMLLSSEDSGGLNEATSDIFGTMVEFFDNNPKQPPNYLLGEHVFASGKPFRYMFKPSLDAFLGPNGRQYASYDCYPKSGFDNTVDEHLSSGTGNHFFYLLSEGAVVPKSHQSTLTKADLVCNGNTALRGITNRTAAQIWYRALTLYMTESTTYPQAREATQQAAMDLKERGLLSAGQVDAVACAWEAVDVPLPKGSRHKGCLRL